MVVGPKGEIIAFGKEGIEETLSVTLSYNKLNLFRKNFNTGLDWDSFAIEM